MSDPAEPALTAGHAKIKVRTRMMDHVKIPKETRLVTYPVKPVINKVIYKKEKRPCPPGIGRKFKWRQSI